MNAEETRQRILELFEAALQEKPATRPEYLLQACGADDRLWAEVSSLVAEYEFRGETVEPQPAVSGDSRAHLPAAGSLAGTTMRLAASWGAAGWAASMKRAICR